MNEVHGTTTLWLGSHRDENRLKEEGIENSWARHQRHHLALKAGLEAMGLKYLVKEGARLPQMNAVHIPDAIKEREAEVRKTLATHASQATASSR